MFPLPFAFCKTESCETAVSCELHFGKILNGGQNENLVGLIFGARQKSQDFMMRDGNKLATTVSHSKSVRCLFFKRFGSI